MKWKVKEMGSARGPKYTLYTLPLYFMDSAGVDVNLLVSFSH